ncbi:uncharacterized protein DMAD_00698 [Drosophila madeirensis]|uniref:Envelope protein n=2 Tax=Drosophila madeirensis TaxID=30013 RepID=A0AAU9FZT7_DROMD
MQWKVVTIITLWVAAMETKGTFEIRELKEDEPIAQITLGPARVIQTYKTFIHIVRLDEYVKSVDHLQQTLKTIQEDSETKDLVRALQNKLDLVKGRMETISPRKRSRRGLINGLGSVVKAITGNLDAEDADKLEQEIRRVQEEEKRLNEEIGTRQNMDNRFIIMFRNLTQHINEEQVRVNSFISSYKNGISKTFVEEDKRIYRIEYIDRISITIDMIAMNLNEVTESLLLARVGIIPKFILNKEESRRITQNLEDQRVQILSEEHMYEFLELKAIMNGTDIIFSLSLPIFKKEMYLLKRILPLPINKTEFVIAPNFVAYNNNKMYYYKDKCQQIRELYTCKNDKSVKRINEGCLRNLVNGEATECETKDIGLRREIFEPEKGYIAIFNGEKVKIQTDCGHEEIFSGSAMIIFNDCATVVNNIQYEAVEQLEVGHMKLEIPQVAFWKKNRTTQELGVHELRMEDIKTNLEIGRMRAGMTIQTTTTYAALGVLLVGAICTVYLSRKTTIYATTTSNPTSTSPPTFVPTIPPLWSVAQTEGGGVTTSASILTLAPPKPPRLA